MRVRWKEAFVVVGWGLMMASIALQALYHRASLSALDLLLILLASVLAGMVLVDVSAIVFGYVGSFLLTLLLMFFCLTLPAMLGRVTFASLGNVVSELAVVLIMRSMIPAPLVLCLFFGLIGGVIGERLHLD